jgi:hypothetical protein
MSQSRVAWFAWLLLLMVVLVLCSGGGGGGYYCSFFVVSAEESRERFVTYMSNLICMTLSQICMTIS